MTPGPGSNITVRSSAGPLLLIACIFFAFACYTWWLKYEPVKESDLVCVTGRLTNQPVIYTSPKHKKSVAIYLDSRPGVDFLLTDDGYKASVAEVFVKYAKRGDSVLIKIKRTDDSLLKDHEKPVKESDNWLFVYGLQYRHTDILKLEDYNKEASKDFAFTNRYFPWIFGAAGLYFVYWWMRRRNLKKRVIPEK